MQAKSKRRQHILQSLETVRKTSVYDIEYNMDETDREILACLQQSHPWVNEETYELVMDRLEKEHHFLQRIAMTKISDSDELSDECNICGEKETEDDDFLVFCDGCNIAVHQSCYGVPNIPEGNWLCRPCLLAPKKTISCILCQNPGGAYKRTSNGFWCHVLCGTLVPGARFENASLVEPIDTEDVHRSQNQCIECGLKKGAVVPCGYYGCRRSYHATCAVLCERYIDLANCIVFCHDHDPHRKAENILTRSPDANYPILEHTPKIRRPVLLWTPQRRIHSEIESVPIKISDYVVNTIVLRDLDNCPDASQLVKDMFAVWQVRKKDRPIIKRLRIDALPDGFRRWGARKMPHVNIPKDSLQVLKEFSLPKEICLPEADQSLYEMAVLGVHRTQMSLKALEQEMHAINKNTLKLETDRMLLISKFIPGYTHMQWLFNSLARTDKHDLFKEAVTDDIAPGYSSMIQHPVSLDMIKKKISKLKYKSYDDMLKDVETLVANAYKYNGRESFIGIEASRLEEVLGYWALKKNSLVLARLLPQPYLPYVVVCTEMDTMRDALEIKDLLTGHTYLIERDRAIKIDSVQAGRARIAELNKATGATPSQEKEQQRYMEEYAHRYASL
ncbi:bromodomain and PHD finger-containing protein 1 [Nematocida major]|uniref:bromodomain and PHD finger-containing protein 1 n=1 Tax=Nematocida major TaxID=1912982 RepID=UPI0020073301|nr:bromodomain and PHD finger-containing protein 1 [Nematocida major]KAH9387374.1 bromodomain and PHD finger-containing protein 1 [Nematocida major]